MKTIGFIDYFLSEWHANRYPEWIGEQCGRMGLDMKLTYAYAELDNSPYDGVTTAAWCERFGVQKCSSIDELCEKSDSVLLLSPDNPEKHLAYAEKALKYGKPTYIDKTFAPDLVTAKQIFWLSEKYGAPIFSSSALRYSDEIKDFAGGAEGVITTGGGRSFDIYAIHQIEMIQKIMGNGAKRVMSVSSGSHASLAVDYGKGRNAVINYSNSLPFSVDIVQKDAAVNYHKKIESAYFNNLIGEILKLFAYGTVSVKKEATLEVIALRDACIESQSKLFEWIEVKR